MNIRFLLTPAVLCGTALLAGCGGTGTSSGNTAQVRAVNAVPNGGNATLSVSNNAIAGGSQGFFTSSSYQSVGSGTDPVTFTLGANPNTPYLTTTQGFTTGDNYSLILVGRADITAPTDPRYPTLLVTSDTFTTPSTNGASLRIVQAAPDAGGVDVLANGVLLAGGTAYKGITSYLNVGSGSVTLQVNAAGTSTVLAAPQTLSLTTGHVYTVYVVEPTVSPTPAYSLQETDDSATAGA